MTARNLTIMLCLALVLLMGLLGLDLVQQSRTQRMLTQVLAELDAHRAATPPADPANPTPIPTPAPVITPRPTPTPPPALPTPIPTPAARPLATIPAAATQPANPPVADNWPTMGPTYTQIARELLDGQYDAVIVRFDSTMAMALTKPQLIAAFDPLRTEQEGFKSVLGHTLLRDGVPAGLFAQQVHVATTKGNPVTLLITLDRTGRIAGLYVK